MSRFDRFVQLLFTIIVIVQLGLGTWRARMIESSVLPAIALAGVLGAVGLLWYARRHDRRGAWLAKPVALLSATFGALSAITAMNAPMISVASRVSTPLLALSIAAVLILARQQPRYALPALLAFVVGFVLLQIALTADARWEAGSSLTPMRKLAE